MGLGNSPRHQTVITLEARKSFGFGLNFMRASDRSRVDLTGCTVRLVIAQPQYKGGAVVLTKTAGDLDITLGMMRFELQAADLDLVPDEYPFDVTLVSSNGYSSPVMKGVVVLGDNTDLDTSNVFAGTNPSSELSVLLDEGDVVEVLVDQMDGMAFVVRGLIDSFSADMQTQVDNAAMEADNAAVYATNSQNSATAAGNSATAAANSATAASGSATTADTRASAAAGSASQAATSATQAATSATDAAASATSATGSKNQAATSATNAANSAAAAQTSATNAATSETNAAGSATAAAASAAQAESIVTGDLDPVISDKVDDPASQTHASVQALAQATTHDDRYYTEAEIDAKIAPLAVSGHNHDDRYFTETEIATLLAGKSDTGHTHTKAAITDFAHSHPAAELGGTGTRDATTFLRGDNVWAAPPNPDISGKLDKAGGTITGDLVVQGKTTLGDANQDIIEQKAARVETHTRSTTNTYTGGKLTQVLEKDGTTTVRTTTLTYTGENLTQVVEVCGGKTVTTTLTYTGSDLTDTTRTVA